MTETGRFRVAIIGRSRAGNYGHQLDVGFARHPRSDVVAVADEDATGRVDAQERTRAARSYADYREMLEREDADVVVVAPRHVDCHAEMVVAALTAGAHVYCEKPLAQSPAGADRMTEAANVHRTTLANALPWIHEERAREALRLVSEGAIGRLLSLRAVCKCDHRGGGEGFLILGLHFADMMRRFCGDPLDCRAYVGLDGRAAVAADRTRGGEEIGFVAGDSIVATYTFPRGVVGTIESWRIGISDRSLQPYRMYVHGTEGILAIRAPYADHSMWLYPEPFVRPGGPEWQRLPTEEMPSYADYHLRAAGDFFRAIDEGRAPACSGADGAAALDMILGAYASHLAGRAVQFPLEDRRHPLDPEGGPT